MENCQDQEEQKIKAMRPNLWEAEIKLREEEKETRQREEAEAEIKLREEAEAETRLREEAEEETQQREEDAVQTKRLL